MNFKVFTHDFRSPIQAGVPVWDGVTLPFTLPEVALDNSPNECAAGWNYCEDLAVAFEIAGLWPTGWPSVAMVVEPASDAIARGRKRRASSLTLLRHATEEEVATAIDRLSEAFFPHARIMAKEQRAWRLALGRPHRDEGAVECGLTEALTEALSAQGTTWHLEKFLSAKAVKAAWDAKTVKAVWDAKTARAVWDVWGAWDTRAAWGAWDARAVWAAKTAKAAWAAWDVWDARAAWDAKAALAGKYVALQGWIKNSSDSSDLLTKGTVGLRNAYANGLEVVVPVATNTRGWAMVPSGVEAERGGAWPELGELGDLGQ